MKNVHNQKYLAGFSLVELMVTIVALAILMTGALVISREYVAPIKQQRTEEKMDEVLRALSVFVQTHWRLPCPADPDPSSGNFGEEQGACTTNRNQAQGVVPYRTLAIPEEYARDGWGNYYTYVVSPVFTVHKDLTIDAHGIDAQDVHSKYTRLIKYDANEERKLVWSLLPLAQYCGGRPGPNAFSGSLDLKTSGDDLVIYEDGGSTTSVFQQSRDYDDGYARNDSSTFGLDIQSPQRDRPFSSYATVSPVTGIAMALVSHGRNSYGSFLANGTGNGVDANDVYLSVSSTAAGDEEKGNVENILGGGPSNIHLYIPNRDARSRQQGSEHYDDTIVYMTQEDILGYAGGGSCEYLE